MAASFSASAVAASLVMPPPPPPPPPVGVASPPEEADVRGFGAEVAEQVAEGVTRVVVRGDHPSEEKLEDAQWWGIPIVDAAFFLAMLRGDGVAAAPSSSRRAPKRRRRK